MGLIIFNALALGPFHDFIEDYLNQPQSFPSFNGFITTFYPRLEVETQRFPTAFFLGKYEQVIYRANLVILFSFLFWAGIQIQRLRDYFERQYTVLSHLNSLQIKWFTVSFYLACIYYTYDWPANLLSLTAVQELFKPVGIVQWIPFFPNKLGIYFISITYFFLIAVCILYERKFWASIGVALLFLYQLGLLQGFEKIDHTYATFTYAVILLPLFHQNNFHFRGMAIAGIRISIGLAYLFSALEKLMTGGLSWLSGHTIKMQLLANMEKGHWFLYEPFPQIASLFVLLFQFFFVFSIVSGRACFIFVVAGILFHWSTAFLIDVGGYDSPWIFMYIFLFGTKTFDTNKK